MSDITRYFEYSTQLIDELEKAVNDKLCENSCTAMLHPSPSINDYMDDVKDEFLNNSNRIVAQYGTSGGGRYVFFLFRFKNITYHIWTCEGKYYVMK
jgi:hypothetical protein